MPNDELPDTKSDRVDWVIRAPNNEEMRRRYDIWAAHYDSDIGSLDDYLAPAKTAEVAAQYLDRSAQIMDAGAGTGLLGQVLRNEGFSNIVAVDYSAEMLDIARKKQIYTHLQQYDLSRPTDFEENSFDGVVTSGTTSQMPCASLREFSRIIRPNGKIVFAVLPEQWVEYGYAAILTELETTGQLAITHKGPSFQMMPTTEPHFYCEIWVMTVGS